MKQLTKSEKCSIAAKRQWSKISQKERSEKGKKLQLKWMEKTTKKDRKKWALMAAKTRWSNQKKYDIADTKKFEKIER